MGGCHRLDFDRVENRPFFLALHRQLVWVAFKSLPYYVVTLLPTEISTDGAALERRSSLPSCCIPLTHGLTHMDLCCIWTASQ